MIPIISYVDLVFFYVYIVGVDITLLSLLTLLINTDMLHTERIS
jgi:hypothetical protein